MYEHDLGVPQDYAEAAKWFRLAAEQGDDRAMYNLGLTYSNGLGIPRDYAEAAKWFRLAAEQSNTDAQYNLGVMYENGQGVPQDHAESVKWYRMAAEQRDAFAQHSLGVMYLEGLGVPQDNVRAHMWFDLAASRSPPGELRYMAVKARDLVAERMTPAQITEAEKLAREWHPRGEQALAHQELRALAKRVRTILRKM